MSASEPIAGIILQARMGSTRLPGKVLLDLHGCLLLERVVRRLQACTRPEVLVIATSSRSADEAVVELGSRLGVDVFRGSEEDVVDRYYRCAVKYGLDYIVRATGDNPFVDPTEVDRLIDLCTGGKFDFAIASAAGETGFPLGVGVQVFHYRALTRVWRESTKPGHREHVDDYIHDCPQGFSVAWMEAPPGKRGAQFRLTVDTAADLDLARELYALFYREHAPEMLVPIDWVVDTLQRRSNGEAD